MINLKDRGISNPQRFSPLSEEQQFNEVCILLQQDIVAALKLANSTLKNKKYFQDLLEKGLESANASEIEIWLKHLVPRLGFRYVVNVLEKKSRITTRASSNSFILVAKISSKWSQKGSRII